MQDESTLVHCEYVSDRRFDEVVGAFERAVGSIRREAFRDLLAVSTTPEKFEAGIRAVEGPSGFIRFLDIDHGAWMARIGLTARCKLYVLGNPLIAQTMLRHDLGAGLNVPLRLSIYEDSKSGKTHLTYDLPSSLMSRLANPEVTAAAKALDAKVASLARLVTGTEA